MAQIPVAAQTATAIGAAVGGPVGAVVGAIAGVILASGATVVAVVALNKQYKQKVKKAQQQLKIQKKLRKQVQRCSQLNKMNFLKKQKQFAAQRQRASKELDANKQLIADYEKKSEISSVMSTQGLQMKEKMYLCPFTFQLINQIGRLPCGHIFEKQEIEKHFEKDTRCPYCRQQFQKTNIYKDQLLQQELDYFKRKLEKRNTLKKS